MSVMQMIIKVIIFTGLISQCMAHLPKFPDPSKVYIPDHWKTQSEGIYLRETPFTMYLFADSGDKLELSLSIPGHNAIPSGVEMSITGPGASSIVCSEDWNGWATERSIQSKKIVPSSKQDLEYEPFGVGYYRSLRACNGTFPQTGRYVVNVMSDDDFHYSIGLGMAEEWANFFNPVLLPISLARVFHWSGRSWFYILAPIISFDFVVVIYCNITKKSWTSLGSFLTLSSVLSFFLQFCFLLYKNDNETTSTMWTTVILHFLVPASICTYFIRYANTSSKLWPYGWVNWFLCCYLIIGAWQAYLIPQLIILGSLVYAYCVGTHDYGRVSTK